MAPVYQNKENHNRPQRRKVETPTLRGFWYVAKYMKPLVCLSFSFSFSNWCLHYSSSSVVATGGETASMHVAFFSRNSSCWFLFAGRGVSPRADGVTQTSVIYLLPAFRSQLQIQLFLTVVLTMQVKKKPIKLMFWCCSSVSLWTCMTPVHTWGHPL